jgi:hypothetical protein
MSVLLKAGPEPVAEQPITPEAEPAVAEGAGV